MRRVASATLRGMAQRAVVHIGLMKSGTTYLQSRLTANIDRLDEHGILFPGPRWPRQVRAVRDFLGTPRPGGPWRRLVAEMEEYDGAAVLSMEFLARMRSAKIRELRSDLGQTPTTIVITVRDLGRNVPAMWQETVKNGASWGFADYVTAVRDGGEAGERFWRQQDAAAIARRWAKVFTAESVTVVTVPPPGSPSQTLWGSFLTAAGIPHGDWAEPRKANPSMAAATTRMLCDLNRRAGDLDHELDPDQVKAMANRVLAHLPGEPTGFAVPGWLRERADQINHDLLALGSVVLGSPEDLVPRDVPGVAPDDLSPAAVYAAALDGLAAQVGPAAKQT